MGSRVTLCPSAVAVKRIGLVACWTTESCLRRGMVMLVTVPYAPASTTGPYSTAWMSGSSGVGSSFSFIGRVTSTRSPVFH
ncbi:hypothetical protein [Streptomyces sp. BRA346]|uniref:hypothetical protein n=1 Tax=Streptomyces sp. BRA346 TaxID=2878199 RepID=UPI0040642E1E